jgi:hypothetical protein
MGLKLGQETRESQGTALANGKENEAEELVTRIKSKTNVTEGNTCVLLHFYFIFVSFSCF